MFNISARPAVLELLVPGVVIVVDEAYVNAGTNNPNGAEMKLNITVSSRCMIFEANDNVKVWIEDLVIIIDEEKETAHKGAFVARLSLPTPFERSSMKASITLTDTSSKYRVRDNQ